MLLFCLILSRYRISPLVVYKLPVFLVLLSSKSMGGRPFNRKRLATSPSEPQHSGRWCPRIF
ncbi:hypothetical protein METHP14_880021 [Pseudomonas sp. P14-2025]